MFYVLDGRLAVYVMEECFHAGAGACVFMPRRQAHAFKIQSSELHMLALMTPGGFMNATATMAIPAQSLDIPPDDGITYATVDLAETIKVFAQYGVRFLAPEEIARDLPAFRLTPSHLQPA